MVVILNQFGIRIYYTWLVVDAERNINMAE